MTKYYYTFLEYLFLLFVVLEFNTPYTYFPLLEKLIHYAPIIILSILLLPRLKNLKNDFIVFLVLFGALLPMTNVAEGHILQYIRLYMILFPLSLLYISASLRSNREHINILLVRFSTVIFIIACLSLVFWLFGSILEYIPPTGLIPNAWADDRLIPMYYGFYFETQEQLFTLIGERVVRNSGLFNEAPMFNMVLCIAVSIELFVRKRVQLKKILILTIAVLSTITTTGYIVLIFMFFLKLYYKALNSHKKVILFMSPFVVTLLIIASSAILSDKQETNESSYTNRKSDIVRCIEVGIENPILGIELFHETKENGSNTNNFGFSNSLFGVFAHGGLYTLSLYLLSLVYFPFLYYRRTKDISLSSVFLFFFVLFTFTFAEYKYVTIVFMATGISLWNIYFITNNQYNAKSND